VTDLLKELHRIVNEAIRAQKASSDGAEPKQLDISKIDMAKLRAEFANVKRKPTAIRDIRVLVEERLQAMLRANPQRMDYYKRYQEIVAEYNRDKDRVTFEETFAKLVALVESLDEEQRRAAKEGLSEDELALFDLLKKDMLTQAELERVKVASRHLLASLQRLIAPLQRWTDKEQTQAEVEVFIIDRLIRDLGTPPYTEAEKLDAAKRIYDHVWQQSAGGMFLEHVA
jgi:type I restriction enzyme, R subunit